MKSPLAALLLSLSACTTMGDQAEANAPVGQCSADPIQSLVGNAFSEALVVDAQKRSGARAVRVIRPGQAVTMDYREDRLNIALDARDNVESLRCG